jgi:hypothetical protein
MASGGRSEWLRITALRAWNLRFHAHPEPHLHRLNVLCGRRATFSSFDARVYRKVFAAPLPGLGGFTESLQAGGSEFESGDLAGAVRFLLEGSPFCCGEPGCHLWLFGDRLAEINERLTSELGLGNGSL